MNRLFIFVAVGVLLMATATMPLAAILPNASAMTPQEKNFTEVHRIVFVGFHAKGFAMIGGNGREHGQDDDSIIAPQATTVNLHGIAFQTGERHFSIPSFDGTVTVGTHVYNVTARAVVNFNPGGKAFNVLVIRGKASDGSGHHLLMRFILAPGSNDTQSAVGHPAGRIGANLRLIDLTGKLLIRTGNGGDGNGSLDHFSISSIGNQTVGQPFSFTVSAISTTGTVLANYNGTVTIGTDNYVSPAGNLTTFSPQSYTFMPATDHGMHTFFSTMYNAMTGANVNATGSGKVGMSNSFAVSAGPIMTVTVAPSSASLAPNSTATFMASAFDQYGNALQGHVFSWSQSSPLIGTLSPGNSSAFESLQTPTKTAGANGTVTATANGTAISGSSSVTVTSSPIYLDHFALTPIPTNQTAGNAFNFTVIAIDNFGHSMQGFNGMVNLTTTDGSSPIGNASKIVPSSYVFKSFENGRHLFRAALYNAARAVTITATGWNKTGTSNPFTVVPGAVSQVTITPSNITLVANATVMAHANATDAYGNHVLAPLIWSVSPSTGLATVTPSADTFVASIKAANVSSKTTGTLTVMVSGTSVSAMVPVTVNP